MSNRWKFRPAHLGFAVLLGTVALPHPALALELFGYCLIGKCESQANDAVEFIDPRFYSLTFDVDPDTPEKVQDAVKSSSQLWLGRDAAVAGEAGIIARSKGDYRRILAALYDSGYYGGTISITVNGREAADLPAFQELPTSSNIAVTVEAGPVYRFSSAAVENRAPENPNPDDKTIDLDETGYIVGEEAKAASIRKAGRLFVEEWRQQGYAKAEIAERVATAVHPDKELNVRMRMAPGRRASYGDITVSGTERMDPDFVAYMIGVEPGAEFDPDDLERARKRLDRLGVFSSRRIEEAAEISASGLLPLSVIVNEQKLRRIGLGATLSSVDGIGIQGYWLHRNLFGKAESLRLEANIGGLGATFQPDEFDYSLGATFTKPGFYNPDTDLISNIFAKRDFNETFDETSAGASLGFKSYYSDKITLSASGFASYGKFDDAFGDRRFLTAGFQSDIVYDGRDSKLDPTEGFYARFDARPFYEWEFGNPAARFEAEARTYYDLSDDGRTVLAGRVLAGSIVGQSISETPPDLLFTAGGGNSVRGYSHKSIGIEQADGDISGGRSVLETSLELRRKFTETLGAVAFLDAGIVGEDAFTDFSNDVKLGVGVGLRYYTGLGPIRLDVAMPLDPGKDDAGFAIYAGIGQAF
ncbi:autotransporter assembly complex family protein [Pseudahrensia aquimaris]|uniref:Autotransporter assembly complex family protein n=1 Tax=Pseudahrensia aquimaris TaxID=744461 RepID=A0ABW3FJZ5_9HYPH